MSLNFNDFNYTNIIELMPGKDYYLDHIVNSIINPDNTSPENY